MENLKKRAKVAQIRKQAKENMKNVHTGNLRIASEHDLLQAKLSIMLRDIIKEEERMGILPITHSCEELGQLAETALQAFEKLVTTPEKRLLELGAFLISYKEELKIFEQEECLTQAEIT